MPSRRRPFDTTKMRRAIVLESLGNAIIMDVPVPEVRPIYALCKPTCVALNPVDFYSIDWYGAAGGIAGSDFSGTVLEVGRGVEQDIKPGDRVSGFVHGNKTDSMDVLTALFKGGEEGKQSDKALSQEIGAYANTVLAHGDLLLKLPPHISDEEGAGLGMVITVTGMALYQALKLNMPDNPTKRPIPLLIGGGATGSGAIAIQLAKLSGYRVITTCSPNNFDYVKSLGADYVYDYNDPDCPRKIRRDNPMIQLAYETGREELGWKVVEESFSMSSGGRAVVNKYPPVQIKRDDVTWTHVSSYLAFGQRFSLGPYELPDMPEVYTWAKSWYQMVTKLLWEGKLKPHRPVVREGGLEGILEGIQDMREEKIRGHKLVYRAPPGGFN